MNLSIDYKIINPLIKESLLNYGSPGSAGLDLRACIESELIIKPGETFEYTSFCLLKTPVGKMEGSFRMITEDKIEFDVEIKPFKLIALQVLN